MSVDYTTGELLASVPLGPLAAALAKAQATFPAVTRSKTVRVKTKTGGEYTFAYAPLDVILDAVRKPLADNGLAVAQLLDRDAVVTLLLHESGAILEARTPIPSTADVQAFGSAITYLRRYAIQALLGIAAEEDDDGNTAAGNRADPTPRRAQRAAPTGSSGIAGGQTSSPPPSDRPATPAASTPAGSLSDEDWAGLVEQPPPLDSRPGLSARDFFDRVDTAGIDRRAVGATAKKMYGADKWKVTELTDVERAGLLEELTPA